MKCKIGDKVSFVNYMLKRPYNIYTDKFFVEAQVLNGKVLSVGKDICFILVNGFFQDKIIEVDNELIFESVDKAANFILKKLSI